MMKLPKTVRDQFRAFGREGGRARAARMAPEERAAVARKAAMKRWIRNRFGASSFEDIGLPGGEIMDAGLEHLAEGRETIEGLLVSLAAPRLRREGVPLPPAVLPEPEERLYRLLERVDEEMAHARYLAYLRQAASFADACAMVRGG
jgi:hypothetical protein